MSNSKKTIIVISSVLIVFVFSFVPGCFGLTSAMTSAVGLFIGCMLLWLTEALPISVSTLMMICLLPITGLMNFEKAIESFGVNTSLFIMASSGITVAISMSSIPGAVSRFILDKFKERPKSLVFSVGFATLFFSAFMSSLAACVLFEGIISPAFKDTSQNKRIKRCLMIAIPACAGIGGFMSPAGTPANILIIDVLAKNNINIDFAFWCVIGFPIGVLTAVLFLGSLILINKPCEMNAVIEKQSLLGKRDISIIIIVSIVIIAWFLTGFVKGLSITMAALIGLSVMFIPKLDILNIKTFSEKVNWDLVITIGSVSVLMTAIADSGIFTFLIKNIFGSITVENSIIVLAVVSACVCVIRAFVPTTSAVVALFTPALISVSAVAGIDLRILMFLLAFWAASAMLLVYTEPIFLITYKNKCYTQIDLFESGIIPSIIMIFTAPVMLMLMLKIFN